LQRLWQKTYLDDVIDRNKIRNREALSSLTDALCSSVGSLTNPNRISNVLRNVQATKIDPDTISKYMDCLKDAFLFEEARRYNIKGNKYFENIKKYYAIDVGLRNAKLNFRQQERSHLMENMIYLELVRRGYSVDVGVVEVTRVKDGKKQQSQYEIDFVVNTGQEKIYIQSALNVDTEEKQNQETFSLKNSGDLFRKIVIVDGKTKRWTDENGIIYIGVIPFLLEKSRLGL
jgi:predicted AAA+ superfamily ATPase